MMNRYDKEHDRKCPIMDYMPERRIKGGIMRRYAISTSKRERVTYIITIMACIWIILVNFAMEKRV